MDVENPVFTNKDERLLTNMVSCSYLLLSIWEMYLDAPKNHNKSKLIEHLHEMGEELSDIFDEAKKQMSKTKSGAKLSEEIVLNVVTLLDVASGKNEKFNAIYKECRSEALARIKSYEPEVEQKQKKVSYFL
jgi:hypothetical protein